MGKTATTVFCTPRFDGPLPFSVTEGLKKILDAGNGERDIQSWLNEHPEVVGRLFSWGTWPTIIRPHFSLGTEYVTDFLLIDAPQWVDIYLIELENPSALAFNKDGTYSRSLNSAIKQTNEWKLWVNENHHYFSQRLARVVDIVSRRFDSGQYEAMVRKVFERSDKTREGSLNTVRLDDRVRFIRTSIDMLKEDIMGGHWRLRTGIVIGRRTMYGEKEKKLRRGLLQSTDQAALFSYDALLDAAGVEAKY